MASQPESRLQKRIRKHLEKTVGGWWVKFWGGPFTPAGVPDLIGCVDGLFFALEVKLPKKRSKPSAIQLHTIKLIVLKGGGVSTIVRSPQEAEYVVNRALAESSGRDLPVSLLRQLLDYNPHTGVFKWKERSAEWFDRPRDHKAWNSRFSGKVAGRTNSKGYICFTLLGRKVKAHRAAWAFCEGVWPTSPLDHRDRNKKNNRRVNLRKATGSVNQRNIGVREDNKTGVTGVYRRRDRWKAYIRIDGQLLHLGSYRSLREAKSVREEAEAIHGFKD